MLVQFRVGIRRARFHELLAPLEVDFNVVLRTVEDEPSSTMAFQRVVDCGLDGLVISRLGSQNRRLCREDDLKNIFLELRGIVVLTLSNTVVTLVQLWLLSLEERKNSLAQVQVI